MSERDAAKTRSEAARPAAATTPRMKAHRMKQRPHRRNMQKYGHADADGRKRIAQGDRQLAARNGQASTDSRTAASSILRVRVTATMPHIERVRYGRSQRSDPNRDRAAPSPIRHSTRTTARLCVDPRSNLSIDTYPVTRPRNTLRRGHARTVARRAVEQKRILRWIPITAGRAMSVGFLAMLPAIDFRPGRSGPGGTLRCRPASGSLPVFLQSGEWFVLSCDRPFALTSRRRPRRMHGARPRHVSVIFSAKAIAKKNPVRRGVQ